MASNDDIDNDIMVHLSVHWRKIAFVVGRAMMHLESDRSVGQDDMYFAERVEALVKKRSP